MAKDALYNKLIHSKRWTLLRARKIAISPICEDCAKAGIITEVQEIHHERPCETAKSEGEMIDLMFDINNLVSLCRDCHHLRHKTMGSNTKAVHAERIKNDLERFKSKYI